MFPILSFSQKEMDYSNVVNDYFIRCYNDPQLKEDGNYLIAPGDKYPVPKNPILYISYLKGRNENRDQAINSYFKKQLNKTDWNPAGVFNKLVNSGRFDTSYIVIKNKNANCIGGLLLYAVYFVELKKISRIYLSITKFNSKHPSTQADFIIEYAYINGRWKYVSEKMLSIT